MEHALLVKIAGMAAKLGRESRWGLERHALQHGTTTVLRHSFRVAALSLSWAAGLGIRVDEGSLIRGALLHDYFLYDWHIPGGSHSWHGFTHPARALSNAREDFDLTPIEEEIIRRHMFPLTPVPPMCREAWLVCLADKVCALGEILEPRVCRLIQTKRSLRMGKSSAAVEKE